MLKWVVVGVAVAAAAIWILRRYVLLVTVEGISMAPTLRRGDRVIFLRGWPTKWLRRGDVVLIQDFLVPNAFAIKRCVGLPGDRFVERHVVLGQVEHESISPLNEGELKALSIPSNAIFVEGDAPNSIDSRAIGLVNTSKVAGIALLHVPSTT